MTGSPWTDERVAKLKKLWAFGHSASQIARIFGDMTRNSVISKVHRLRLPTRSTIARKPVERRVRRQKHSIEKRVLVPPHIAELRRLEAKMKAAAVMDEMDKGGPEPLMVPLLDLDAHMCRWPIGDVHDANFAFCGHDKAISSSYCPHHHARSRTPVPMQRRVLPAPARKAA